MKDFLKGLFLAFLLVIGLSVEVNGATFTGPVTANSIFLACILPGGCTGGASPLPLPTSTGNNAVYIVIDGASAGDCTTGGGTATVLCRNNGAAWESLGDGTTIGAGGAPDDAQYWTRRSESGLSGEFNMGSLTTGLLKHTVSAGSSTPATAVAGAGGDYVAPGAITTSGLTIATARLAGRTTASTGALEEISVSGCTLTGGVLTCSGGSGTVTSVVAGSGLSGGTITSSGTIAIDALGVTNAMLAGSIAASKLVGTDITTVGTIATGTWQGTTIAVNKGGTGQTSYSDGQLLIGNGATGGLSKATLTAGSNVTITNGNGTITIAAAGGGGGGGGTVADGTTNQAAVYTGTTTVGSNAGITFSGTTPTVGDCSTKCFSFSFANAPTSTTISVILPNSSAPVLVAPSTGSANNFLTGISSVGALLMAQPAFTNLSGTATFAQLPLGAPASDDQVYVSSSSSAGAWKSIPDCPDTGGNHYNYTASTNTWSCGTSSSGGAPGDAAADGATKGIAGFLAADFNAASGIISLDYTNAQAASGSLKGFLTAADWTTFNGKVGITRSINTTAPLGGGSSLVSDITLTCATCTTATSAYGTDNAVVVADGTARLSKASTVTISSGNIVVPGTITTGSCGTNCGTIQATNVTGAKAFELPNITGTPELAVTTGTKTTNKQLAFDGDGKVIATATDIGGSGGTGCETSGSANQVVTDSGAGGCTSNAAFLYAAGTATLGTAGSVVGAVAFKNATSGTITLQPVTGALGTVTLSMPATTGTVALVGSTVASFAKSGSTALVGAVTLSEGSNIALVQSGQNIQISATGTGYSAVQNEGSGLTTRATINFIGAGVDCADNSGSSRTDCTISGGGGGGAISAVDSQTIATDQTTTSATFTDLATSGPDVTLATGTQVIVSYGALAYFAASEIDTCHVSVAVSGATTIAASDTNSARVGLAGASVGAGDWVGQVRRTQKLAGLTAGSNTFTLKYRNASGTNTCHFTDRDITVMAY